MCRRNSATFLAHQREVQELARASGAKIEQHYGRPMDIEWAKDGHTGKLFIVQASGNRACAPVASDGALYATCAKLPKVAPLGIVSAQVGQKLFTISAEMNRIERRVLVTDMTDPDLGTDHEKSGGDCH